MSKAVSLWEAFEQTPDPRERRADVAASVGSVPDDFQAFRTQVNGPQ